MPPIATFQGQAGRNKRRGSMPWRNAFIGQGRELGSGNVIGTPMMNKNNARFPEPQSVSQHHVPFGLTNESTPQVTERAKHGYDNGIDDDEGGTYTPLLRQSGPDNSDYEDQPKPKRRKVDGDRTVSVYVEDKQQRRKLGKIFTTKENTASEEKNSDYHVAPDSTLSSISEEHGRADKPATKQPSKETKPNEEPYVDKVACSCPLCTAGGRIARDAAKHRVNWLRQFENKAESNGAA